MRTHNRILAIVAVVSLSGLALTDAASAQLGTASAATLGTGGNATATVRGFGALSLNPAGLGMPGAGFSLALIPITVRQGLGPVGLADLKDVEGTLISSATKEQWLADVLAQGGQQGSLGVDVTEVAVTFGRVGFQLSTQVGASMSLAPDIVEVILYGNAGRTGQPANLSLGGSTAQGFGVTTGALSFGIPVPSETGAMAVGATLKYSVGHGVAYGEEQGGSISADPIKVDLKFPVVMVDDEDYSANAGSGFGVDVGFQMERDRLHFGASVQNLFNTFAWDEDKLVFRAGSASLEKGSNSTDFDKKAYASAPAGFKQAVDDMTFDPVVSVGAAYDVQPDFTVSADVRNRFGDGMSITPKLHAGVGAEYRGLGALHVRGGGALVTDGFLLGGGASLILGPVNLSLALAMQSGDKEDTSIGQFTLSFGGR
ncbi:MAG: hypothetical protein AMXMBFR53_11240 [Gemmatimonadota bacterium]